MLVGQYELIISPSRRPFWALLAHNGGEHNGIANQIRANNNNDNNNNNI